MARKETKKEYGKRVLNARVSESELSDSRVIAARARIEKEDKDRLEEEERRKLYAAVESEKATNRFRAGYPQEKPLSLDQFGRMDKLKEALDKPAPEKDSGYSVWDIGVSADKGARSIVKGALGLPVNLLNAVNSVPQKASELVEEVVGRDLFGDYQIAQPEIVRGMRAAIDERGEEIYQTQASNRLKAKSEEFGATEGVWNNAKFLATNPGFTGLQGVQQGPQMLVPGAGVAAKIAGMSLSAGSQNEAAVSDELRKQGLSESEIAKRASDAFVLSTTLNAVLPKTIGSTFLEGVLARKAAGRVVDSTFKTVASRVGREAGEEVATEVGDQYIQNIQSNRPATEGLAQAGVMALAMGTSVAGPVATLETARESGRVAHLVGKELDRSGVINKFFTEPTPADFLSSKVGATPADPLNLRSQDVARDTSINIKGMVPTDSLTTNPVDEAAASFLRQPSGATPRVPDLDSGLRVPANTWGNVQGNPDPEFKNKELALKAAQKRIEIKRANELKAADKKFAAGRTKYQDALDKQTATLPADQAAAVVSEKMDAWDAQNTKPSVLKAQRDLANKQAALQAEQAGTQSPPQTRVTSELLTENGYNPDMDIGEANIPTSALLDSLARTETGTTAPPLPISTATRTARAAELNTPPVTATTTVEPIAPVTAEPITSTEPDSKPMASDTNDVIPEAERATLEDLTEALVTKGRGSAVTNRLGYMIADGNVQIVASQNQIPGDIGRMEKRGKGWYDPEVGKIYVVANELAKTDIRGQVLETLTHETGHGGRYGGSAGLKAGKFSNLISQEGVNRIADKIRKQSPEFAQGIVDTYTDPDNPLTSDEMNEELVRNYGQIPTGNFITAPIRDLLSSVATSASKLGVKDVSLADVQYLSKELTKEVVRRGERFTPDGSANPRAMFVGSWAKGADITARDAAVDSLLKGADPEEVRKETGWQQGTDGEMRFEISDAEAKWLPTYATLRNNLNLDVPLKEVLDHPTLFKAYPWMKLLNIQVQDLPDGVQGGLAKDGLTIIMGRAAADSQSTVIHELQHVVQMYEGFARGGNTATIFNDMTVDQQAEELDKEVYYIEDDLQDITADKLAYEAMKADPKLVATTKQLYNDEDAAYANYIKLRDKFSSRDERTEAAHALWKEKGITLTNALKQLASNVDTSSLKDERRTNFPLTIKSRLVSTLPVKEVTTYLANKENRLLSDKEKLIAGDPDTIKRLLTERGTMAAAYKRLSGEVEARLTQKRRAMSDSQRAETSPAETRRASGETRVEEEITLFDEPAEGDVVGRGFYREETSPQESTFSDEPANDATVQDVPNRETKPSRPMASASSNPAPANKRRMPSYDELSESNPAFRITAALLTSSAGQGTAKQNILESKTGTRAELASKVDAVWNDLIRSISSATGRTGKSRTAIANEIDKDLERINKLDSSADRRAEVILLNNKYPGMGTALVAMRDMTLRLNREAVAQRAAPGNGPLTEKELNTYDKILREAERYTTRAYRANLLDKESAKYTKRMLKAFKAPEDSADKDIVKAGIDFILNTHVVIPPRDAMDMLERKELVKIYEQWRGDATNMTKDQIIDSLDKITRLSGKEYYAKALDIAKELMGEGKSRNSVVRGYGGQRVNRTILESRKDVPVEIRALMGEITDPFVKSMLSVTRLINLTTQTAFLQDIYDQGKGIWWDDKRDGAFKNQLNSAAYGPLKGMFVNDNTAALIEPVIAMKISVEDSMANLAKDPSWGATGVGFVSGSLRVIASVAKAVDLITVPVAMATNLIGSPLIVIQNGANPLRMKEAMGLTIKALSSRYTGTNLNAKEREQVAELFLSGVLDSATVGEQQGSTYKNIFDYMGTLDEETVNDPNKMRSAIIKFIKQSNRNTATEMQAIYDAYAFMDVWAKTNAFLSRRDMMIEYHAKENPTKTRREIVKEVGSDINFSNISYTRALGIIKAIERYVPVMSMYLTYFSEVPRSIMSSYTLAIQDLVRAKNTKNPEAKATMLKLGLTRFGGTLAVNAGIVGAVSYFLSQLTKDEERKKETDPDWEKYGIPLSIGKTIEGHPIYTALLRFDPNGPYNDFLVNLIRSDDPAEAAIKTFKSQFVQSKGFWNLMRLSAGILNRDTENYDDGYDKVYGEWVNKMDDYGYDPNLGRNLAAVIESFTPKLIRGADKALEGTVGKRRYEVADEDKARIGTWQTLGLTPMVRDPVLSLEMKAGKYKAEVIKLGKIKNENENRHGRWDTQKMIEKSYELFEAEQEANDALWKVYDGTLAFDNDNFKPKITYEEQAKAVIKGKKIKFDPDEFKSSLITKDYLDDWVNKRMVHLAETVPDLKERQRKLADLRDGRARMSSIFLEAKKRKE